VPVFHGGYQLFFSPLPALQAVKEEHLSNPYTDVMEDSSEAKIADQHAAQPCQTAQHDIKEEPTLMSAPTITPKTDVSAPVFAFESGQEVPLASDAVKQEATCFSSCGQNGVATSFRQDDSQAVSGCSPLEATEEAGTDQGDMLAAAAVHSSGTASPSTTVQDEAQGVQGNMTSGTLLGAPTTESESRADPTSAKVCVCLFDCHGKLVIVKCTQCFVSGVQAAIYLVIDYCMVSVDMVPAAKADACYGLQCLHKLCRRLARYFMEYLQ